MRRVQLQLVTFLRILHGPIAKLQAQPKGVLCVQQLVDLPLLLQAVPAIQPFDRPLLEPSVQPQFQLKCELSSRQLFFRLL